MGCVQKGGGVGSVSFSVSSNFKAVMGWLSVWQLAHVVLLPSFCAACEFVSANVIQDQLTVSANTIRATALRPRDGFISIHFTQCI